MQLVLALALAAPLASPRVDESIVLRPAEGLVLRRHFEHTRKSEQEHTHDEGSSSATQSHTATLVVLDRTLAVADGRATKVSRTYEEILSSDEYRHEGEWGSNDGEMAGTSELEDETVTYTWDEDEEAYAASGEDLDEELLDDLGYDLDFTALLPSGAVDEGDEWELEPETFTAAIGFLESIPLEYPEPEGAEEFEEVHGEGVEFIEPEIEEETDGEITLTFRGTREADGVKLAVIEIEGEIETERVIEHTQEFDEGTHSSTNEAADTVTYEGELLWDLEHGHLFSLELEIELEMSAHSSNTFEFQGQSFDSESDMSGSGEGKLSVRFERVEDED